MLVTASVFVASIIIVRFLSKQQFGEYTFLKTCFLYAWLLGSLGLNYTVLRFTSELAEKGGVYGHKRLLKKCFSYQAISIILMLIAFPIFGLLLKRSSNIGPALMALMVVWAALMIWKETVRQFFLAHYWVRFIATVSVCCALTFPFTAYLFLYILDLGVAGAIMAEAFVYLMMILCYFAVIKRLGKQVQQASAKQAEREKYEISTYLIFRYSGAYLGNMVISLLSAKTAVIVVVFFILGEEMTGVFGLAVEVAEQGMMIILIPIMGLIMAALTRAYSKDNSRLPSLIRSYYKLIMIMLLPIAFGSIVFMDKIMRFIYQEKGVASGQLGRVAFVLFVSIIATTPMSAALNMLEKAQHLIPVRILVSVFTIAMVVVGILFWKELPYVGHTSPLYAIIVVFILRTLLLEPLVLIVGRRLMGRLHFPVAYFFRVIAASSFILLLWPMRWLWDRMFEMRDIGQSGAQWGLIGLFVATLLACVVATGVGVRLWGLFGQEEVHYFQNARFPGLTILMKLLVPSRYRQRG